MVCTHLPEPVLHTGENMMPLTRRSRSFCCRTVGEPLAAHEAHVLPNATSSARAACNQTATVQRPTPARDGRRISETRTVTEVDGSIEEYAYRRSNTDYYVRLSTVSLPYSRYTLHSYLDLSLIHI